MKLMRKFSPQEDAFLWNNYLTIPAKRMSKMMGRSESGARQRMKLIGIIVPPEVVEKFKQESYIKKGSTAYNKGKKQSEYMTAAAIKRTKKTRFKKGNLPHNTKPKDGIITIRKDARTKRPYKHIRLSLGKWVMLHVVKWENKHGKVPKGKIIAFKDGNSMNCTLKNLQLITREENMQRNTIHRYPAELKQVIRLNHKLKRKTSEHKKQNQ